LANRLLLCDREIKAALGYEVMPIEHVDGNVSFILTDVHRKLVKMNPVSVKLVVSEPLRSLLLQLFVLRFPHLKVRRKKNVRKRR